jgi:hypothetical protein
MPLSQAERYLDHLTSCSPCYRDFSRLQGEYRQRRTRMIIAVAASVLIVAAIATWATIRRQANLVASRTVIVDLRNRSLARGTEPPPGEPPVEIPRTASHLKIYLPLGTDEGPYDIRLIAENGEHSLTVSGTARIEAGVTSMAVNVDLASLSPGSYRLQLREDGSQSKSYPVLLK